MKIAILKSFTYNRQGGNPAGVVILDENIREEKMQKMASDIGLSETAFVKKEGENIYDVRFFTPECEVDLCGHATIATFYFLAKSGYIKHKLNNKTVYQKTKAGKLKIEINYKNGQIKNILMQQSEPKEYGIVTGNNKKKIADSLNISINDLGLNKCLIEPTIVSTGLKDILIPIKSRSLLNNIVAKLDLISEVSKETNVVGYHLFTIENKQIYTRN